MTVHVVIGILVAILAAIELWMMYQKSAASDCSSIARKEQSAAAWAAAQRCHIAPVFSSGAREHASVRHQAVPGAARLHHRKLSNPERF